MVELLAGWILRCHRCASCVGGVILSLGGAMVSLGLRVDHRIAHAFSRPGATSPETIRESWPWWVNLMIPEGATGFALAFFLILVGCGLLVASRWARKYD